MTILTRTASAYDESHVDPDALTRAGDRTAPDPQPGAQAFLHLTELAKHYNGKAAVAGLDLQIQRGEFISLLGPSGCGKTTTLHMIAGFLEPDAGDILLEGQSLRGVPSHQRGAVMVFQNYALFPHMTVFGNVAFGLRMARVSAAEITSRVSEALALVHLSGMEKRWPRELSGGQQQRVALARALVLRPRLLLLDEPLSNLDAGLRRELRDQFVEIHRLTGMTTILVTHDLEEAFATSDRVAILGQGQLQQFDSPRDIYLKPRTRFVADFVGHENVLEGVLSSDVRGRAWLSNAHGQAIAVPPVAREKKTARFSIPAHALHLSSPASSTGADSLPLRLSDNNVVARIASVNFLGATYQVTLMLDTLPLRAELPMGQWNAAFAAGRDVRVTWSAADMIELPLL